MAEPAGARWMFPRSHRAIALRPEVGGSELMPSGVQTAHVPGGNIMAPISTPSHGRRLGMHARALLSVSKTIQTPPPVGGYPRGCTFPPKAKPSSYLPTTLGLCWRPPNSTGSSSWHHSINEAMGRLVRLIDQVVVETNPPSQGSRPPRSGSIAATEAGDARAG